MDQYKSLSTRRLHQRTKRHTNMTTCPQNRLIMITLCVITSGIFNVEYICISYYINPSFINFFTGT